MRMKKNFTIVKVGTSQHVVLRTAGASSRPSGIDKAVKRTEQSGIVNIEVKPGQHRKLTRETAKLIGAMLADPITDTKRDRANALAQMAKTAAESPITARFRRVAA